MNVDQLTVHIIISELKGNPKIESVIIGSQIGKVIKENENFKSMPRCSSGLFELGKLTLNESRIVDFFLDPDMAYTDFRVIDYSTDKVVIDLNEVI